QKRTTVIKKSLEKERIKEDFFLDCQNTEEIENIKDPNRESVYLLKEHKYYYPIVMVMKDDENTKNMTLTKTFTYASNDKNIVNHVMDFYKRNCAGGFLDDVLYNNLSLTARSAYTKLKNIGNKKFMPKYQIIDSRNKCKYIVTTNSTFVPVRPSGSIYNLQILKNFENLVGSLDESFNKLTELYKLSDEQIPIKPTGIYYDKKSKGTIHAIAIMTQTHDIIPITAEDVSMSYVEQNKLAIEDKPLYDKIDKEIMKGKHNFIVDDRIKNVNYYKYYDESYELFRLTFSDFINKPDYIALKKKIEKIMTDENIIKKNKMEDIRTTIYKLIDKDLLKIHLESIGKLTKSKTDIDDEMLIEDVEEVKEVKTKEKEKNKTTEFEEIKEQVVEENKPEGVPEQSRTEQRRPGKYDKLVHIANKLPDLSSYQINNDRNVCSINENKDTCAIHPHCHWVHSGCYLSLTRNMIVAFVNKISEELASNDLKAMEIMKIGSYFVSDVVSYDRFTERAGQKVVRSTSNTIKKVLSDLFGKENVPKIGKRRGVKSLEINYQEMNIDNPLKDLGDIYIQHVMDNNLSIYRGYVNGYYWLRHPFYDVDNRNLGYYSLVQTDLANYFKSLTIDWLQNTKNRKDIENNLFKFMETKKKSSDVINDFVIRLGNDVYTLTSGVVELYALNKIQKLPILVTDDNNNIVYIFDDGLVFNIYDTNNNDITSKKYSKYTTIDFKKTTINLRFSFITNKLIPDEVEILYYK
ncbi:MAG: early transcription factor VETF large subunit, partial [Edafosvirus sp.]